MGAALCATHSGKHCVPQVCGHVLIKEQVFIDTLLLELPRGASVSSGSLTICQEVVLVGDGSLVLN